MSHITCTNVAVSGKHSMPHCTPSLQQIDLYTLVWSKWNYKLTKYTKQLRLPPQTLFHHHILWNIKFYIRVKKCRKFYLPFWFSAIFSEKFRHQMLSRRYIFVYSSYEQHYGAHTGHRSPVDGHDMICFRWPILPAGPYYLHVPYVYLTIAVFLTGCDKTDFLL